MVDLLDVSAGRIRIRDTDNTVVFDTDERLFCVTDSKSGTKACSGYTATNTYSLETTVNVTTMHNLGSINSAADIVRGSFKVTTSGQGSVSNIGWFNASGTYVHFFDATAPILGGGARAQIAQIASYTFLASGGVLYLRERVYLKATDTLSPSISYSVTLLSVTFDYNLLCGTFV